MSMMIVGPTVVDSDNKMLNVRVKGLGVGKERGTKVYFKLTSSVERLFSMNKGFQRVWSKSELLWMISREDPKLERMRHNWN